MVSYSTMRLHTEHFMKLTMIAASLLAATLPANAAPTVLASPAYLGLSCTARVIYSEVLPFGPINTWLVKAILEITPPGGNAYLVMLQNQMAWQGPPPRRGQLFRVLCDPSDPANLHLISRLGLPASF
jgi:hypothetical protein